jgi:hypothetical protein
VLTGRGGVLTAGIWSGTMGQPSAIGFAWSAGSFFIGVKACSEEERISR